MAWGVRHLGAKVNEALGDIVLIHPYDHTYRLLLAESGVLGGGVFARVRASLVHNILRLALKHEWIS